LREPFEDNGKDLKLFFDSLSGIAKSLSASMPMPTEDNLKEEE
jgi:hypothetical protein